MKSVLVYVRFKRLLITRLEYIVEPEGFKLIEVQQGPFVLIDVGGGGIGVEISI